jgi:uncharacterized protein (UPF0254 family)
MGKVQNDITIVLPKERFKGSVDSLISIPIQLNGDRKELIESDRSINLSAFDQSVTERNESTIYRISGKISQVFSNVISGTTDYDNYKNYMYLTNPITVLNNNNELFNNFGERVVDTFGIKWGGIPQYSEFSFIRGDYDNPHYDFEPQSASTYNWSTYLSYVYSSDTQQKMTYFDEQLSGNTLSFVSSDGIPFTIINTVFNGKNLITFRCGGKHNLRTYEYVELSFSYNDINTFRVYQVGESGVDNYETTFSIINPGFTGGTFADGVSGTLKRIVDINNPEESKSKYYVKLHKIITNENDVVISKMAFENVPFVNKEKVEYSALTPNLVERTSTLNGTQSYSFSVNQDINVNEYTTTFNKPLTEIYLTIVNKGYGGWFNKPNPNTNTALQYGWDFNFNQDSVDEWWSTNNLDNYTDIPVQQYNRTVNGITYLFYYNQPLNSDDVIVGDFCEYNDIEQQEYLITKCNHKITFNDTVYQIEQQTTTAPPGYFYKVHYPIQLRKFSNSINTNSQRNTNTVPTWAYWSENRGQWRWKELLPPDSLDEGLDVLNYPFVNGAHYVFSSNLFLITTPYKNINLTINVVDEPIIDDCE